MRFTACRMVSPSGIGYALSVSARALAEAELDQHGGQRGARDRIAVNALDPDAPHAAGAHVAGERLERRPQPRVVVLDKRQQALARALEVHDRLGVDEHYLRAGHALGSPRIGLTGPLGPRQRGAVELRRVDGGEHERRFLALDPLRAQALDRAGQGELRRRRGPRRNSLGARCPASPAR